MKKKECLRKVLNNKEYLRKVYLRRCFHCGTELDITKDCWVSVPFKNEFFIFCTKCTKIFNSEGGNEHGHT